MCFGRHVTHADGTAALRSRALDRRIRTDEKRRAREVKLLLLGAGESGKSTVLKQMKLIYAQGFSKAERLDWKPVIFRNLIEAFRTVATAMGDLRILFEVPENEKHMALVIAADEINAKDPMPEALLEPLKRLWADNGVQRAIAQSNALALQGNIAHFCDDLDRLWAPAYVPSDQDLLRSRQRTTGITEAIFALGSVTYRMFDVGGQRSERKKWIHCFENVTGLVFLVAISGYDQCLVEDADGNQMHEALMLWEAIANSQWFSKSALILFLNKMDLFRAKLPHSSLADHGFTDYTGPPRNVEQASKYFSDKFRNLSRNPAKRIYVHLTNATDTNLLKITMASVQDTIIQRNLTDLIM